MAGHLRIGIRDERRSGFNTLGHGLWPHRDRPTAGRAPTHGEWTIQPIVRAEWSIHPGCQTPAFLPCGVIANQTPPTPWPLVSHGLVSLAKR